ncbi:MAG: AMP-binding protein [Bacteroidota bacterium]
MYYPNIIEKFCEYEASTPGHLFLSEPVKGVYQEFTWQQAGEQVRSMATALNAMGYGKDDKIAILSKNCAHWIMADLAIAMAGCVSVPLYPNISAETLQEIIIHSESKAIFIGKLDQPEQIRKGVPDSLTQISFPFYPNTGCINWDDLVAQHAPITHVPKPDPQELACIVYTSGTTGQSKGVMHTYHAMAFAVGEFLNNFPDIKKEVFFSYLPLCHVAERMLVECGTIFTGSTVYFVESLDTFAVNLAHTQPTVFLAVPRIWEKMQEGILKKMPQQKLDRLLKLPLISTMIKKMIRKKLGLAKARHIFTGASPINPALLLWYARLGIIIQEAYGMTENVALSHVNKKENARFGTVGQPYAGVEVRLGKDNEVQVKSDASMLGYYKEPALSAQYFEDGYLKTGDEGSIDAEGFLTITGRIKDQFKTGKGKYITPAPMENQLSSHQYIGQVCVVGSGQPAAMVLCTLTEQAKRTDLETVKTELTELLQHINNKLEHHEQLARMIICREEWTIVNGLLTPTLKIKRKNIDAQYGEHYANWYRSTEMIVFE